MNKKLFNAYKALSGDTNVKISQALHISYCTLTNKLNGVSSFKQNEIKLIADRWNLDDTDIRKLFFS